jgi:uncharacterized protein YndB with AHSA1/START domain
MSGRSVEHGTFVIERSYEVTPAQVFAAWSDPEAKARWFGPDQGSGEHRLDFRVDGCERLRVGARDGSTYLYAARYQDIVPDKRIVYAYDMHHDDVRISVSLATVELASTGNGTKLTFTEQAAYLDGQDSPAQREHGTEALLENLGAELTRATSGGPGDRSVAPSRA